MKYMHFKASCSYAGLANLLELAGVDTEDAQIALEMGLPWLFAREGETYLSGPMLQSAAWFNLWLRPRGFVMEEVTVRRQELLDRLRSGGNAMLGIETPYGKHAVVYTGYDGHYRIINPTYENSREETEFRLSESELLRRVEHMVVIAHISRREAEEVDIKPILCRSLRMLRENVAEIEAFSSRPHAPQAYTTALNRLFRPLLLDGITMLELAGETALADRLRVLQGQLMTFMRGPRDATLSEALSLPGLHAAAAEYAWLIGRASAADSSGQTAN